MKQIFKMVVLFCVFSVPGINAADLTSSASQSLCEEGKRMFKTGRYKKAEKVLKEAIQEDATNAEAHYFLGYTLDRIERNTQKRGEIRNSWQKTEMLSHEFETALSLQDSDRYTGEIYLLTPRDKIMSLWSDLALWYIKTGDDRMARKAFVEAKKRGGFDEIIYRFMLTMLQSCPKGALLFTGGDMDTYYPIYIQFMEHFRTDVAVLNLHLLKEPWFLKLITGGLNWQDTPIQLDLSADQIQRIEDVVDTVTLPLDTRLAQAACNNGPSTTAALKITDALHGNDRKKIQVQDYIILSIIKANPTRQPCVASTIAQIPIGYKMFLEGQSWDPHENFVRYGLVYKLDFCESNTEIWIEANENLLKEVLKHRILPESRSINDYNKITQNYISWCIETAARMDNFGRREDARHLIRLFVDTVGGIRFLSNDTQREYLLGIAGKN